MQNAGLVAGFVRSPSSVICHLQAANRAAYLGKKEATDAALRKKLIKKHLEKMEKKEKKEISATNAVLMSLGARNHKKAREIYDAAVERCGGTAPVTMMCAMVRATDAAHRPFAIQLARALQLHGARPHLSDITRLQLDTMQIESPLPWPLQYMGPLAQGPRLQLLLKAGAPGEEGIVPDTMTLKFLMGAKNGFEPQALGMLSCASSGNGVRLANETYREQYFHFEKSKYQRLETRAVVGLQYTEAALANLKARDAAVAAALAWKKKTKRKRRASGKKKKKKKKQ